jgi:hypothetical protein
MSDSRRGLVIAIVAAIVISLAVGYRMGERARDKVWCKGLSLAGIKIQQ